MCAVRADVARVADVAGAAAGLAVTVVAVPAAAVGGAVLGLLVVLGVADGIPPR